MGVCVCMSLCVCMHVCMSVCLCTRVCAPGCIPALPACPAFLVLEAGGGYFLPYSIQEAENRGQAVGLKDREAAGEVAASPLCGCCWGAFARAGWAVPRQGCLCQDTDLGTK